MKQVKTAKTEKAAKTKKAKETSSEEGNFNIPPDVDEITEEQKAKLKLQLEDICKNIKRFRYGKYNSLVVLMTIEDDEEKKTEDEVPMRQVVCRIGSNYGLKTSFVEVMNQNPEMKAILRDSVIETI